MYTVVDLEKSREHDETSGRHLAARGRGGGGGRRGVGGLTKRGAWAAEGVGVAETSMYTFAEASLAW